MLFNLLLDDVDSDGVAEMAGFGPPFALERGADVVELQEKVI